MADVGSPPTAKPSKAMQVLLDAEVQLEALPKAFDPGRLAILQAHVSSCPDIDGRGVGEVVTSLLTLLRRLQSGGCCDRAALIVHVRAWRLMLTAPPEPEVAAVLLDGLKQIRDRYGDARAA